MSPTAGLTSTKLNKHPSRKSLNHFIHSYIGMHTLVMYSSFLSYQKRDVDHGSIFVLNRRLRWRGHVARIKGGMSTFKILTNKSSGRPRHKREDSTRMCLKEIGSSTRLIRLMIRII